MDGEYWEFSPMATITARCPSCDRVFYVDTDFLEEWLALYAPRAEPGRTVRYPCPKHLVTEGDEGLPPETCAGRGAVVSGYPH
jgi:hypothetical protein